MLVGDPMMQSMSSYKFYPGSSNELSGLVIILADIWLRAAKSQKNDHSKRTGNVK